MFRQFDYMKKGIHPDCRLVVFKDMSCGATFLTYSTAKTDSTIKVGDQELPLIKVETSSASHDFYKKADNNSENIKNIIKNKRENKNK